MIAMAQGVDIGDDEETSSEGDLPEEVLAAERKFKADREARRAEEGNANLSFGEGLGYEVVS